MSNGRRTLGTGERLFRAGIERFEAVKVDLCLASHRIVHHVVLDSALASWPRHPRASTSSLLLLSLKIARKLATQVLSPLLP
jgi:hypothetical protein